MIRRSATRKQRVPTESAPTRKSPPEGLFLAESFRSVICDRFAPTKFPRFLLPEDSAISAELSMLRRRGRSHRLAPEAGTGVIRMSLTVEACRREREQLARTTQDVVDFRVMADEALAHYVGVRTPAHVLGEDASSYMKRVLAQVQNRLQPTHQLARVALDDLKRMF